MDRVVSQLLAELSSIQEHNDIFVIGATNRPDLIDPALLVPGRFDKLLYLGVSEDHESQLKIITALTRKFHLAPDTSLEKIATSCPLNLTGADLYALCADANLIAIKDKVAALEKLAEEQLAEYRKTDAEFIVEVDEKHFFAALENLQPSVSVDELRRYKEFIQRKYNHKQTRIPAQDQSS